MNAIGKILSKDINVVKNTKVVKVTNKNKIWEVQSTSNTYKFDMLLFAIPNAQVKELINIPVKDTMVPCYSLMGNVEDFSWPYNANLIKDSKLSWLTYNKSTNKSGTIVALSTNTYAAENEGREDVFFDLKQELEMVTNQKLNFKVSSLHFWKYANAKTGTGQPSFFDPDLSYGACGDWFIRGTVEGAYKSSQNLSNTIINYLKNL